MSESQGTISGITLLHGGPFWQTEQVVTLTKYPPEVDELRSQYIKMIEAEKQEYQKRIQPYIDELVKLEKFAITTMLVSKS